MDDQPLRVGEPEKTIYVDIWQAAMRRLKRMPARRAARAAHLRGLVEHVEKGWGNVRELQRLFEANAVVTGLARELLEFIDGYLIDLYKGIALDTADLVPGGPNEVPEWIELDGDSSQFHIFLVTLHLAANSPEVPSDLRSAIRAATEPVLGWTEQYQRLLRAMFPKESGGAGREAYN